MRPYLGVSCLVFNAYNNMYYVKNMKKYIKAYQSNYDRHVIVRIDQNNQINRTSVLLRFIIRMRGNCQEKTDLKKSFLGSEDLHSAGGVLGEVHETAGVRDEPGSNQLPHQNGQVRSNGDHAIFEVLVQLSPVLLNFDHLDAEVLDVEYILTGDLRTHRNLSCLFNLLLHFLGKDVAEVDMLGIIPGAHHLNRPHKGQVVGYNFAELREMPSIPLPAPHDVVVQLFVKIIKKIHSL